MVGLVRDLFPTDSAGVWSSSDRVGVKLIGSSWSGTDRHKNVIPSTLDLYTIISRSTRPLLDQYPITVRSLLDRYSTFLSVKNNRVGNPIDADHPDHLPDWFPIAWSSDRQWEPKRHNPKFLTRQFNTVYRLQSPMSLCVSHVVTFCPWRSFWHFLRI